MSMRNPRRVLLTGPLIRGIQHYHNGRWDNGRWDNGQCVFVDLYRWLDKVIVPLSSVSLVMPQGKHTTFGFCSLSRQLRCPKFQTKSRARELNDISAGGEKIRKRQ